PMLSYVVVVASGVSRAVTCHHSGEPRNRLWQGLEMVSATGSSATDDPDVAEADAIIATLDDFAVRIGLGELSGPAPVVHEYWELFDAGLAEVLAVAATPDAVKKSVTVIAESVA